MPWRANRVHGSPQLRTSPLAGGSLIHIDFHVDDLEVASTRAERAGATRFVTQPNASHCLVFADPAGHPFCLTLIDEVG
ncbi:VOC family protein [Ornithinimicrobium sp. LYQ103]|uniref:VOC family protein n=1 Tax=Ornithinimicrobium sp. LYQ103 TaxID=3378796 RepID=UPI003852B343